MAKNGIADLASRFKAARREINRTKLLILLGAMLRRQTESRFDNEVDPDGDEWAPLSPEYAARKTGGSKILDRTGEMRNGLVVSVGANGATIGSPEPYAARHQAPQDDFPQREFLGLSAGDKREAIELMIEQIKKQLGMKV